MTPALVIVNPAAGRGRTARLWPEAERRLHEGDFAFEVVHTDQPQAAIAVAESAARAGRAVVAAGGDGTVHEVANGLLRASAGGPTVPMGVLPLGSGDDFAKMLPPAAAVGVQAGDWLSAVQRIVRGKTGNFDAGRLDAQSTHYFVNGMDIGFGARGAANAAAMPPLLKGQLRYLGALARTLLAYEIPRVHLSIDGAAPFEIATTMTAVMNGRCFGRDFWVAPDARADDGRFDVMLAGALGRAAILGLVPKIMRGTHSADPRVRMLQATRVTIESQVPLDVEADGELPLRGVRRVAVTLLPGVLRVFV